MAATSFLDQRPSSPIGFGMVLALHAAAIAGVLLIKNPIFTPPEVTTEVINIPLDTPEPPPPVDPEPVPPVDTLPPPLTRPFIPDPVVETPPTTPPIVSDSLPPVVPPRIEYAGVPGGTGTGIATLPPPRRLDPPRVPVRVHAIFDPRFASAMQPPYPTAEQRAEREGNVRVQVTIGTDGRVKAIQRLSATSDAFWRATEDQARTRWRFRPATEDGRPVESSKVLTVHFRLDQ